MSVFGRRQLCDEVHGDDIPFFVRDWEELQHTCCLLMRWLVSLALFTQVDIFLGIFDEGRPVELSLYEFEGAGLFKMSSARRIMIVVEDILSKDRVVGDIDLLLMVM